MGFFDFDAEEADCCPHAYRTRVEVIRGAPANCPRALSAFELSLLTDMHDAVVDNGGSIVHTRRERQPFLFGAGGAPRPAAPGETVDGVSCAVSVCYR